MATKRKPNDLAGGGGGGGGGGGAAAAAAAAADDSDDEMTIKRPNLAQYAKTQSWAVVQPDVVRTRAPALVAA